MLLGPWNSRAGILLNSKHRTDTSRDDHTQYALLAGRSGGQTLIGDTASGGNLVLNSTAHATKGKIYLGANSVYDEVNDRLVINGTSTSSSFEVKHPETTGYPSMFKMSHSNGAFLEIGDGTSAAGTFSPIFTGYQASNYHSVYFLGKGLDTGTRGVIRFNARNQSNGYIATRPLFEFANGLDTDVMAMKILANGDTGFSVEATARGHFKASTSDNAAYGLKVDDSSSANLLSVRNDGAYAFKGGTIGLAQTGYTTFTNLSTDRTCDADTVVVAELADIVGTLIEDLKLKGLVAA